MKKKCYISSLEATQFQSQAVYKDYKTSESTWDRKALEDLVSVINCTITIFLIACYLFVLDLFKGCLHCISALVTSLCVLFYVLHQCI